MTNAPINNPTPSIRTSFVAVFVVLLLLGIAVINLPPLTVPPSKPYITTTLGLNVRNGPSTLFNPPIGSLAANQKADVIARSPDGQWFKITYYNGSGWVFAAYTTFSSDPSRLPVDAGPITPPIMPTTTATVQTTANLVLGNVKFDPALPLTCGKPTGITVEVLNFGSEATTLGGLVRVQDIYIKNNQEDAATAGAFGPIQSGQTYVVIGLHPIVSNFAGKDHKLVVTVNADGSIPETSSTDNSREFTYTLQGDC